MIMLAYAAIAIALLILAIGLRRKPEVLDPDEVLREQSYTRSIGTARWLHLSERIFDPSDTRWLEEELAFPKLAKTMKYGRKRLAIHWLEALQSSFDDLVRTPELASMPAPEASSGSWHMLWLTIRFKLVVSYALFIVKLFGPYHRLIPSFSWAPFSLRSAQSIRRPALANSRSSH